MFVKNLFFLLADATDHGLDQVQADAAATSGELGAAFAKMLLTFAVLIFLLFATYWVVKRLIRVRLEKGTGAGSIHVIEKKMLSPKTMLYVVEIEGKRVLVAESHLEIKQLTELD